MPSFSDWDDLRVRVGTIVRAVPNTEARQPSYKLWIDFGPLGELQSSAKLAELYQPAGLEGRQVVAVTGFEPLRVGGFRSDVLVLGALRQDGAVVLIVPHRAVDPGSTVA